MATITERLAFLISADATQAIRAFDKTANAAEREMNKTKKSIDAVGVSLTRFGARGLAATGTLAAGLFKLSQGAIEDQKAQALLAQQLRQTTQATDDQIASVEKFIDTTARAVGVADDELRPAFQQLIRATGSVTKSQELLNLALDISAGTGKELSAITIALSRAATGQVSSLSRLGIPLSENTKKSKDFGAAVKELNAQFAGQAAVAADTFAGRLARAQIALAETGEEIGTAFIPVVEKSASTVATAANGFSSLNQATGGALATLTSYGTLALGAVSATSLLAGQMIKMRTAFITADGAVTKMGKSLKLAGLAMATLAASDAVFSSINSARGATDKFDYALNELLGTFGKINGTTASPVGEATRAFRDMVKAQSDTLRFSNIWTDWGKKVAIAGGEAKRPIEDVDRAFNELLKKGGSQAAMLLIADMQGLANSLDRTSDRYKDTMMLVDRYRDKVNNLTAAQRGLTKVQIEQAEALQMQEQALEDAEKAQEAAARAAEDYKKRLEELRTSIRSGFAPALDNANAKLKEAQQAFANYSNTVRDAVRSTYSLGGALDEGETYLARLRKSSQDALSFAGNIQNLITMGISQDTLNMLLQSGAETGAAFAQELVNGGQAAVDEADALTESVKQAGVRAGTDAASSYYQEGVNLATSLVSGIDSVIKKYRIRLSSKGLSDKQLKRLEKRFKVDVGFQFESGGFEVPELAAGGIVPATRGGRLVRVAEGGQDEAIIPLPSGMRSGGVGGGIVIHVNAGIGTDGTQVGQQIVNELIAWQRRNGTLPVKAQQ